MKSFNAVFTEVYDYISHSFLCCSIALDDENLKSHHNTSEKPPVVVLHQQPLLMAPPPAYEPMDSRGAISHKEWAPKRRKWLGSEQGDLYLSLRKHLRLRPRWSSSQRRPQISAPSDFRHLNSGSYHIPDYDISQPRQAPRPSSFRPLHINFEVSSPMLPHFEPVKGPRTPPNRIIGPYHPSPDSSPNRSDRSLSPMSFHIPRKPTPTGSVFDSPGSSVVKHPGPVHLKTATPSAGHPSIDDLIERIAHAMLERDQIQDRIEDAAEMASVYTAVSRSPSVVSRRPGSLRSVPSRRFIDTEPMPDIPALPPNAPSFSERLSYDRPRTAPPQTSSPGPHFVLPLAGTDFNIKQEFPRRRPVGEQVLSPPLPLQYRPPLRKKKSFSRVADWLGRQERTTRAGGEPITNSPLPVQPNKGHYEVVATNDWSRDNSYATSSDWNSDRDTSEDDSQTLQTTLASPYSSITSRTVKQFRPVDTLDSIPCRTSTVGVAF
ncbi:hypothetical protein PG996_009704 [Apiospora saccharicola]|uniref:Uncharacterized protein n=1 Tax=Apiospora saccharicola TaxID=335842 RepID=A0ABR1ULJ2_9PEZI